MRDLDSNAINAIGSPWERANDEPRYECRDCGWRGDEPVKARPSYWGDPERTCPECGRDNLAESDE